jgi:hypothetical protein
MIISDYSMVGKVFIEKTSKNLEKVDKSAKPRKIHSRVKEKPASRSGGIGRRARFRA